MIATCVVCGEPFYKPNNKKTCGEKCSLILREVHKYRAIELRKKPHRRKLELIRDRIRNRERRKTLKYKEWVRKWESKPENKIKKYIRYQKWKKNPKNAELEHNKSKNRWINKKESESLKVLLSIT